MAGETHRTGIICGTTALRTRPLKECSLEVPFEITYQQKGSNGEAEVAFEDTPDLPESVRREFLTKLADRSIKVNTSQPAQKSYRIAQSMLIKKYGVTEIVTICPSCPEISGALNAAHSASQEEKRVPVKVVDSRAASLPEGLIVQTAEDMALNGASSEEIIQEIPDILKRTHFAQIISDSNQLRQNGRIGRMGALAFGIMGINAIVTLKNGELTPAVGKGVVKGWERSKREVVNYVAGQVGKKAVSMAIVHFGVSEKDLDDIVNLAEAANIRRIGNPVKVEQDPTIITHTGAKTLGFFVQEA